MFVHLESNMNGEISETSIVREPAPWSAVGSYAMHLLFTRWQMDVSSLNPSVNANLPNQTPTELMGPIANAVPVPVRKGPSNAPRVVSEVSFTLFYSYEFPCMGTEQNIHIVVRALVVRDT